MTQIICDRSSCRGEAWGHVGPGNQEQFLRASPERPLGRKPGRRKNKESGNCFYEHFYKGRKERQFPHKYRLMPSAHSQGTQVTLVLLSPYRSDEILGPWGCYQHSEAFSV